jgi:hypothetical protein
MKVNLDQFYTKPNIAKHCIKLIPNIDQYDLIVEPSAGSGSFSNQISCIAYDLEPKDNSIIKQDWFKVKELSGNYVLVLGNPPFGKRSKLAKDFIKHAIQIGATTIAFVLPNTFSKVQNQGYSLFPQEWKLIIESPLPPNSFFVEGYGDYYVPCTFFVWTKLYSDIDLRKQKSEQHDDFTFLPRGSNQATFCINGNNGKVRYTNQITNNKAEHYILNTGVKYSDQELFSIFESLDLTFYSSINGGNAWIGQQEIIKAYIKKQEATK